MTGPQLAQRRDLLRLRRGMDAIEYKFVEAANRGSARPLNEYDAAWLDSLWRYYILKERDVAQKPSDLTSRGPAVSMVSKQSAHSSGSILRCSQASARAADDFPSPASVGKSPTPKKQRGPRPQKESR